MTLKELQKLKAELKTALANNFSNSVIKSEREIYLRILELLSTLEKSGGNIALTESNLKIADLIKDELPKIVRESSYTKAVEDFISGINEQKALTDTYLSTTLSTTVSSTPFASAVFDQTKRNTIDLLINATPETDFLKSLENIIEVAVRSGQSWKETVELVREYAIGKEDAGKLNQYSKQVAYDAIAINDRAYTSAIADELESEWFLYAGGELPTSRVFCQDRVGRFFHYKEIESWASEDWAGKNDETTEQTIYEYLGGWNCQHTLIPVTIEMVPQDVIDRNIENGNYTPVKN